jgi:hypothetical protein
VFLLVGFWNWVPVTYSGEVWTAIPGCVLCNRIVMPQTSFPTGQNVTVHWVDESGGTVLFSVDEPSITGLYPAVPQCTENGSSGGCSFTSVAGNYTFRAAGTVNEGAQGVNFTATYFVSIL